ncbi:MAG: hypothetical protein ACI4MB_01810, partial [Candidatus Coproplasma sp.]
NVGSKLTKGAHLGVYRAVNNYDTRSFGGSVITSSFGRYNTDAVTNYFFSSDPTHGIIEYSGVGSREAALFCYDNATNWKNATNASYSTRTEMTVKLYSNWTADEDNVNTTFGTDGVAYYYGALRVYPNVQIVLDLNNFKLDRGLTTLNVQSTNSTGYVIYVDGGGSLTVTDTSLGGAGLITGGFNTGDNIDSASCGSGVHVCSGGKFTMDGGNIEGNKGVGLYLAGNNLFSLGGKSSVINNKFRAGASANIFLNDVTQVINVISAFDEDSKFGVIRTKGSTNFGSGTLTNNYSKYNKSVVPSTYFVSDNEKYNVIDEGFFDDESMEAALIGKDNYTNWAYAVKTSLANGGRAQVCTLFEDWTAEQHKDFITTFDSANSGVAGFYRGALYVPAGCHIILDLNGYTIDRALTGAQADGQVIWVRSGTLVIRDSSAEQTGTITGGYSNGGSYYGYGSGAAGGIAVYTGTLSIEGGTITGNKMSHNSAYAGGVFLSGGSTFNMTGGKITGNYGAFTGGVCAYDNATVNFGGSPYISGNNLINEFGATLDTERNLYFTSDTNLIAISNYINSDAKVGISVNPYSISANGRFITSGWQDLNNDNKVTDVFYSDSVKQYALSDYNQDDRHDGILFCRDNQVNWQKTVQASINEGKQKTFVLYENWTASPSGSVTSFGSGTGYYGGALHVPSNASIILDLNGHTIDRGLYDHATYYDYGWVILVQGALKVIDSTAKYDKNGNIVQGIIKGGYVYDGGAIHQDYYAHVEIEAGFFTENKAIRFGGAVFIYRSYVNNYVSVTIGGTALFDKNYRVSGNDMYRDDIGFYYSDHILNIGSEMLTGAIEERNSIYIRRDRIGTFTSGWGKYNPTVKPEMRFKAALNTYRIGSSGAGALREATMLSNNNNDNWVFAINNSRSASGAPELFTLISDWTADNYNVGSYNTRFGSDGNAYRNGALLVPADANIVLDLNGFTLDRNHALNLDSQYSIYNAVIIVEGTLQIIDSSVTNQGTIKGGSYGVFLNGVKASVTLGGLLITEDLALTGTEVNVYGNDKYGGNISGNSLYGVYVNGGTFTATGGKVTGNTTADAFISKTNSTINVGENAYIYTENRKVGSGLRLESPLAMINVISSLSEDAKIGYMRQGVGRLTNGWGLYNGNDTDPFETVFVSEEPDK